MNEILVMIFIGIGAAFILLAAIGILRMPDFYLRMSVTTKAATLGVGLTLIGAAVHFSNVSVSSRVTAIILFLLLTAPVGAHMIGRTSYFIGTRLWNKSVINELKDQYDEETHELYSEDQSGEENVRNREDNPTA